MEITISVVGNVYPTEIRGSVMEEKSDWGSRIGHGTCIRRRVADWP